MSNQNLYAERLNRVQTAIDLGTPDRVPVCAFVASYMQRANGSSYRDIYYDHEAAGQAAVKFYEKYPLLDVAMFSGGTSGKALELSQLQTIDWPGRPGTICDDYSSHQVIEREYMTQEEYPEMLKDFTGWMLRKYIPRAYPALKAFENLTITPTVVLTNSMLAPFYRPDVLEAYQTLAKIAEAEAECAAVNQKYMGILAGMGYPSLITGMSEAPFDILGDYFRGTMGTFEDLVDESMHDFIDQACDLFADQQIQALQYFKYVDMPIKRVFFPLHKAMDGFMSDEQYARFYWKPLRKIMDALIEMGVTPYIYTEGPYNTRLDHLMDVPKGKVIYHFETVDMKEAKRKLGGIACISGNLSVSNLEFGTRESVINETRQLLEDCMPGGGYLFDFNGSLENAKEENLDAMFETLEKYGKY